VFSRKFSYSIQSKKNCLKGKNWRTKEPLFTLKYFYLIDIKLIINNQQQYSPFKAAPQQTCPTTLAGQQPNNLTIFES